MVYCTLTVTVHYLYPLAVPVSLYTVHHGGEPLDPGGWLLLAAGAAAAAAVVPEQVVQQLA